MSFCYNGGHNKKTKTNRELIPSYRYALWVALAPQQPESKPSYTVLVTHCRIAFTIVLTSSRFQCFLMACPRMSGLRGESGNNTGRHQKHHGLTYTVQNRGRPLLLSHLYPMRSLILRSRYPPGGSTAAKRFLTCRRQTISVNNKRASAIWSLKMWTQTFLHEAIQKRRESEHCQNVFPPKE